MTKLSPLYSPGTVMKDSSFLSASEKIARMSMRAEIIQMSADQPEVKRSLQPPKPHG